MRRNLVVILFLAGLVCFLILPEITQADLVGTGTTVLSVRIGPPEEESGGGLGGPVSSPTEVVFSGWAYPLGRLTLLKDGQFALNAIAGLDATFSINLGNISAGGHTFSVSAEDQSGNRSEPLVFPVFVTSDARTIVSGIFIPPSIMTDKIIVKHGDTLRLSGQSVPESEIGIEIDPDSSRPMKTFADNRGVYHLNLDTTFLERGEHFVRARAMIPGATSIFGKAVKFSVGDTNIILEPDEQCPTSADLNQDCRVNLVDFSIAAYWYHRPLSSAFGLVEQNYLNADGQIDLRDFSIMAYYWTG